MKHAKLKITALLLAASLALAGCASSSESADDSSSAEGGYTIAIPNDTTNEARALLLLEDLGLITLDPDAGILATPLDITDNPYNIEFEEVEAAQIPNILQDVDYAVINSNYAIDAGLNPTTDSLAQEGSSSAYVNIVAVLEGNETTPEALALKAAVESQDVADYIAENYDGAVVSAVDNPTDGYTDEVDYDALAGTTISVAASPSPHAQILEDVVAPILEAKGITLDVRVFEDYVQPNNVVEEGEIFANYFQHVPYLDDFNEQNGTHIVSLAGVHVEPMGIYGGQQSSLDVFN